MRWTVNGTVAEWITELSGVLEVHTDPLLAVSACVAFFTSSDNPIWHTRGLVVVVIDAMITILAS
jgi:hypothetical protein